MRIEIIPLVLNSSISLFYLTRWEEPGKILYWIGATILTSGLLLMKG